MIVGQRKIIILSGPTCSGKSSFCDQLELKAAARIIKTRDLIVAANPNVGDTKIALQRAGNALDKNEGGDWVKRALAKLLSDGANDSLVVIDAVRKKPQIEAIRDAYGPSVYHVHLTAPELELKRRYEERGREDLAVESYEKIIKDVTEKSSRTLDALADLVIDTQRSTPASVFVRATALLALYPRNTQALVDVLVGGQYGSEGKGNIVGHIAPEYQMLVRVGGPNAGHKVFQQPEPEVYYHLPSGSRRAPKAQLVLGAGAVIYVPVLMEEIQRHNIEASRLIIDPQAMIIEDLDRYIEGGSLAQGISSTAQGVGWASARKMTARGGYSEGGAGIRLAKNVSELKPFIRDSQELFAKAYLSGCKILLEGTQGTSLSLHHGRYPWVTSRDTTVSGCLADAGIAPKRVNRIIMVCRTYPIRVGGPSGHLEREIDYDELARRSGIPEEQLKATEKTTTTKKQRRFGEFDWEQLKLSTQLNGPTDLALTFVDYLDVKNRDAYRYEQLSPETLRFIEEVERVSGVPVNLISTAFHWRNVIDRRAW